MTTSDFSTYVLFSEKKDFELVVRRDKKDFKVNITKGNIEIKSVDSKIIERDNKRIGYIELGVFASNTYDQFKSHLEKLEKEGFDSLIIDLRGNTGGHLTEVTQIISLFLDKRHVIFQLQKDNNKTKYYSDGTEDKKYPIIFLGNELTASASEVFIISLKENLDAKLVGMKTYGKGTVQELVNLKNGDQYKITTKKWLSPKGNWINDTEGIEPDVEVQLNKTYINNPVEANDNQLEEAIKLALNNNK
jgi:carboxyl-terminal processing protease